MPDVSRTDTPLPLVLIVDDSTAWRALMRAQLSGLALEIEEAGEGGAAFESLLTKRFDLMITDLNMAPVDGRQLISAARLMKSDRRPRIIVCSADHDRPDAATRLALQSADRVLAKPLTAATLVSAVSALLTKASGAATV
jgi:CheY-like chemotaxis protein